MLVIPADVLRPRRPDDHFAAEAAAARDAGLDVALVDHDALARGADVGRAVGRVPPGDDVVYRGWMLTSRRYAGFADALSSRGATLRTSAAQYRRAHELPGWCTALASATPASTWTSGHERVDFDRARRALGSGPAVLRDYTKSMKHYWHEAAFVPELEDADAAWEVACRFRELREEVDGGFVLRRFEPFTSGEVRTWWIRGTCRLIAAHPDTPHDAPPDDLDLTPFAPLVAGLGLPFVTVDLARRTDGAWRIIEVGDGQGSDRPPSSEPDELVAALLPD